MIELKPCPECDADMGLHLRIQELANYHSVTVGAAYCGHCGGEATSFSGRYYGGDEFRDAAYKAWNSYAEVERE